MDSGQNSTALSEPKASGDLTGAVDTSNSGKNVVLCFDGTGDWAADHQTNVFLLFEELDPNRQNVFYEGGIGTLSEASAMTWWRRAWLRLADLAFATSLRDKVLNGYSFLVQNYEPGDRIYLFGFSRGAFSARVLAAMIYSFGILRKEHQNLVPYAWQTISSIGNFQKYKAAALLIKQTLAIKTDVRVHFLGLFDTVSSVGILERFKTYPYTEKNPAVEIVRHAISISEERNAFPEMLFRLQPDDQRFKDCDIIEVWFPGVHRDVGGGYVTNNGLPTEVINWMIGEAKGLRYKSGTPPQFKANGTKRVQLGLIDPYVFGGLYPMRMWDSSVNDFRSFWPNLKHIRRIPENALIHESVKEVAADGTALFRPANLPSRPVFYGPNSDGHPPTAYKMKALCSNVADFVGISLAVALSTLISYRIVLGDFGYHSPPLTGYVLGATFLLYVVFLGFWQRLATQFRRSINPNSNAVLPWFGVAIAVALLWFYPKWHLLQLGLGLGLVIAFVGQIGKRPARRADRVIPYFALRWFAAAALSWLIGKVLTDFDRIQPLYFLVLQYFTYALISIWGLWKVTLDRSLAAQVLTAATEHE